MKQNPLLLTLSVLIMVAVQGQCQSTSRDLLFTISSERIEPNEDRFRILLKIDRSEIAELNDVWVRVGRGSSRESVLAQLISQEILEGSRELPDFTTKKYAIRGLTVGTDWVDMQLEAFAPGEYEVFIRLRDGSQAVHMSKQNITIP